MSRRSGSARCSCAAACGAGGARVRRVRNSSPGTTHPRAIDHRPQGVHLDVRHRGVDLDHVDHRPDGGRSAPGHRVPDHRRCGDPTTTTSLPAQRTVSVPAADGRQQPGRLQRRGREDHAARPADRLDLQRPLRGGRQRGLVHAAGGDVVAGEHGTSDGIRPRRPRPIQAIIGHESGASPVRERRWPALCSAPRPAAATQQDLGKGLPLTRRLSTW